MLRLKYNIIEFSVAVIVGLCFYCANIYSVSNNSSYKYAIELWNYGRESLNMLYPLVFSIPFCWILFYEKNGSYWKNLFNRTALNQYIKKRFITSAFMSAIAMFIVSMGSLLFAYGIVAQGYAADFEPIMSAKFYGTFQISHPVIYAFILSCGRSLLAVLFTVFSMGLTMISSNIFIAMTGAFIYSILENFITAILQIPQFSLCTTFYPNRLSSDVISIPNLMIGPCIMLAAIIVIYIYYWKKEKYKLMD